MAIATIITVALLGLINHLSGVYCKWQKKKEEVPARIPGLYWMGGYWEWED